MAVLDTLTDEDLILRYGQSTETQALEELVQRYYPAAFRTAMHMLGNASCAEDAAQEAFINLIKSSGRFEKGRNFQSWWKGILYNSIRKEARKRTNQAKRDQGFAAQNPNIRPDTTVDTLIFNEVREEVLALPVELREAVMLRYFDGHTHQEVAEILGCAPGTASSRIRRGLESLQESLGANRFKAASVTLTAVLTQLGQAEAQVAAPSIQHLLKASKVGASSASLVVQVVLVLFLLSPLALLIPDSPTSPDNSNTVTRKDLSRRRAARDEGKRDSSSMTSSPKKLRDRRGQGGGGSKSADPARDVADGASAEKKSGQELAKGDLKGAFRLIDTEGNPCKNALVRLQTANDLLQRGRPETLFRPGPALSQLRSFADGRVTLPSLPPQTLLTVFAQKGNEGVALGPLPYSDWVGKTIPLSKLNVVRDQFAVWVSQIKQEECAGRPAKITIYKKNGRRVFFNDQYCSMVAEDGSMVLGDLTPMEAIFVVHIEGFAPFQTEPLKLERSQILRTEIDLKPEVVITGAITLPPGVPGSEVRVHARATDDPSRKTIYGELLDDTRYRFSGLRANTVYMIGASTYNYGTVPIKQSFPKGGQHEGGDLNLGEGPQLKGQILSPKGLPHIQLQVRFFNDVSSPEARGYVAVTDNSGYFSLAGIPEGQYRYRYEVQRSSSLSYDHAFDPQGKRAVAVVKGPDNQLGKVIYDGSADVILLEGQVLSRSGAKVPDAVLRLDDGFSPKELKSDAEGRYSFRLKRAGEYRLQVRSVDFVGVERVLKLELGQTQTVDMVLDVPAARISGRVTAPAQRLRGGLGATIKRLTKKRSLLAGIEFVTCDDRGRFQFMGLEAGRYSLQVGDFQRVITVEAGQRVEEIVEAMDAKNMVAVTVTGLGAASRYRLSSLTLTWEGRDGLSAGGVWQRLGKGAAQFRYLPSGPLQAIIKLRGPKNMVEYTDTVQLVDGQKSLTVPLQLDRDLGSVEGSLPEYKYQWVVLARDAVLASAFVRKDGQFALEDIPAGKYWIVATNSPQPSLDAVQKAGTELEVRGGKVATVSTLDYLKK